MKKTWLYFLFLATLPFTLTHCQWKEKEKEEFPTPMPPYVPPGELPPETQEGWNFFGCRVNGQVWVPRTGSLPVHADYENGVFFVRGQINYNDGSIEKVSLGCSPVYSPGTYTLNGNDVNTIISKFFGCRYETDTINTGQLEITKLAYDTNKQGWIISGRFHFTVVTPGCDTLRVTDGRFDILD